MTLAELLEAISKEGADKSALIQAYTSAELSKVNDKNSELLSKLNEAKTKASSIPEGFTVEKWNELIGAEATYKTASLKGDEKAEAIKKQLNDAHSIELKRSDDEKKALKASLDDLLVDSALTGEISTQNGNAPLLMPHIRKSLKVIEENGKHKAVVIDENGNERFSLKKAGEKMGIDELVTEFKGSATYAPAFTNGNGGGGSGSGGSGRGGSSNPFIKGKNFSYTEQAKLSQSDPAAAKQMKIDAASAGQQ